MRGDLDWIVLKTLEKDRGRRYATASQLADDIGRYLQDETVMATPPSVTYKLLKFAKRNKQFAVAGSITLAVLVLGLAATSWSAVWAMRERQRAVVERQNAMSARETAQQ